ncbi:MAG: hypothetical protein WC776_03210 [Patescibacteria group bacterium]
MILVLEIFSEPVGNNCGNSVAVLMARNKVRDCFGARELGILFAGYGEPGDFCQGESSLWTVFFGHVASFGALRRLNFGGEEAGMWTSCEASGSCSGPLKLAKKQLFVNKNRL